MPKGIFPRNRPTPKQLIERWSIPVTESGCWLWLGVLNNRGGYGKIRYKGRVFSAHRFSWMAANGTEIPSGLCVMHKCDTPSCVNPDHLKLGTQTENMADRDRKGRGWWSTQHGRNARDAVRLRTSREVIIAVRRDSGTLKEIAGRYGLSTGCVYNIRANKIKSYEGINP